MMTNASIKQFKSQYSEKKQLTRIDTAKIKREK